MTIHDFLAKNTQLLTQHGIETARLDCLVLLADVLNTNSAHLLSYADAMLTDNQQMKLDNYIKRRSAHEPLAYIRERSEFYGHNFYITPDVLVPRPESETIIELLVSIQPPTQAIIIDIGTGSGALAIAAKIKFPGLRVIGTDTDAACIKIAHQNANRLGVSVEFLKGNLLDPIQPAINDPIIFLCNLPYVPDAFPINAAAKYEPSIALFGGEDGLNLYRNFFTQLSSTFTTQNVLILTESLPEQHAHLVTIAQDSGFMFSQTEDFIQLFTRYSNY